MTLTDLELFPREWLTAAPIAPVLGTDPNLIRYQAQHRPEKLGFPVVVLGSRVKIPKMPFVNFMRRGTATDVQEA